MDMMDDQRVGEEGEEQIEHLGEPHLRKPLCERSGGCEMVPQPDGA